MIPALTRDSAHIGADRLLKEYPRYWASRMPVSVGLFGHTARGTQNSMLPESCRSGSTSPACQ